MASALGFYPEGQKRAKLHDRVQNRTAVQNVDVPIPRVRWYLGGVPLHPTRAHF